MSPRYRWEELGRADEREDVMRLEKLQGKSAGLVASGLALHVITMGCGIQ